MRKGLKREDLLEDLGDLAKEKIEGQKLFRLADEVLFDPLG